MGERLQERRRKSIKIFHGKEEWYLNDVFSGFRNATQSLRQEKKSQDSRNSKNDRKGRNWHNQQRKKKNNDSRSRSRSNNQHNSHKTSTNKPIKNDKKEWPTLAKVSKGERRKKRLFSFYDESETKNNDQQNEHTIIVPDTQDVPNQIEENVRSSVRDHFFLHGQGATKASQRKN